MGELYEITTGELIDESGDCVNNFSKKVGEREVSKPSPDELYKDAVMKGIGLGVALNSPDVPPEVVQELKGIHSQAVAQLDPASQQSAHNEVMEILGEQAVNKEEQ